MAASIYATPPPDLSSEDTALSDVSNTSSTNTTTNTNTNNNNNSNNNATTAVTTSSSVAVSSSITSSSSVSSTSSSLKQSSSTLNNHQHHHQYQQQVSSDGGSKAVTMTNTCESKSSTTPKLSTSKSKRTIADVFKDKTAVHQHHHHQHQQHLNHNISSSSFSNQGGSYSNESPQDDNDSLEHSNTDNGAMVAVAAAANAAMQMQLLEALSDAAKKRRKQHNPTRMDDDNKKRAVGLEYEDNALLQDEQMNIKREQLSPGRSNISHNPAVDYEDKLSKMFLPKSMEHLKETFELLQQQQQKQFENISKSHKTMEGKSSHQRGQHQEEMMTADEYHQQQQQLLQRQASEEEEQETYNNNPYQTYCKECGENFENEFKLSLHMLQEHNEGVAGSDQASGEMTPLDILAAVKVKMERPDCESPLSGGHNSNQGNPNVDHSSQMGTNGKDHQQAWMRQPQMPPMGFPFPPEAAAAAALQAGGYLPLLAVPGFPGVDGLNRPPLRIFNPEAFCELCNKEFCNKYFLKTHKANKHGIYDPVGETAGPAAQQTSTMNAMNQMFQLQMQQQQQHLQQQHQMQMELAAQQQQQQHQQPAPAPPSHPKLESTRKDRDEKTSGSQQQGSSPVYCDICSKRFTNVFAMRRHRTKAHEQNANQNSGGGGGGSSQRNSPNNSQQNSTLDTTSLSNSAADLHSSSKQFQMPDGFRQDFALEQEEVSFTPQPRKLSPQSQQQARDANFAHDKLKRLGVINPESFCELCCKEYCNKYFLRTHKWKRHGIFMPPEDTENLPKMANWPFMNMPGGVPVNLMMAQRLMVGAENNSEELEQQSQPSKRIKLEASETDEEIAAKEPSSIDENQENRSENNQNLSVPSTPEPHKLHGDNPGSAALTASSEAAMGLQNLQKLQSMIQQLNDLNGKRPLPCHLCGREMENQYALQAHLMAEHSGGLEGMAPMNFPSPFLLQQQQQQAMLKHSPNGSPGSLMPAAMMGGMAAMAGGGELRCTPCDREFSNLPEFQKHITEAHLLAATKGASPLREGFVTPDRPVNASVAANIPPAANRAPYTLTPTSSYCEICNKELCNKYFMKTHMQRMHGIEIENGAQIGGVVCNICNKELCSKYFLRVHKHNTHGIIEDGAPLPQPRQNGVNNSSEAAQSQQPIPPPLSATAPESLDNLPRNLNMSPFGSVGSSDIKAEPTSYTDSCPICNRRFRSAKWLRSHLLNDHGASGMEKLRELEQQYGSLSKPSSPTLKIPNGSSSAGTNSNAATPTHPNVPSPAQLAQALQNLNAQQLLQNIPKQQHQQQPMNYKQERNVPSPRLKEYQCSLCSFTTPYYAFLFIHERTHSIMNSGAGEEQHDNEDKAKALVEQQQEEEDEEEDQRRAPSAAMEVDKNHQEMIDESQPTNLSMRTPSPRPRPSSSRSLKEELLKETSASSPVLALSRENSVDKDKDFTGRPKHGTQSAACSPIYGLQQHHLLLQEMAEQFGKTASYAVPREMANESAQSAAAPQMQAFVLEEVQTDDCNRFVPAIIYLPVRERITGSMKVSFNLTPV